MADDAADEAPPALRSSRRRAGCWALLAVLGLLLLAVVAVWLSRERIAGNVIGSELAKRGIEATYEIERIGPRTQILRNVVLARELDYGEFELGFH